MKDIIDTYYNANKIQLHKLFEDIENTIDGRICHSSIILLKILCNIEKQKIIWKQVFTNGGSMSMLLTNNNSKNLIGLDLFGDMYNVNKHLNYNKYSTQVIIRIKKII